MNVKTSKALARKRNGRARPGDSEPVLQHLWVLTERIPFAWRQAT